MSEEKSVTEISVFPAATSSDAEPEIESRSIAPTSVGATNDLIRRSPVPENLSYVEYRPYLRKDFIYTCAYCTIAEFEAQGINFTIDHYEPRKARPDLENTYSNLMYCCNACNQRKGDRNPPPDQKAKGVRFFRPDQDRFDDHFSMKEIRLNGKTPCGEYTIDAIDLNRHMLWKLRELRKRADQAHERVIKGVHALRNVGIDQLPVDVRIRAKNSIERALRMEDTLAEQLDKVLAEYARSDILLADGEIEDQAERQRRLDALKQREALSPGKWRAPRVSRAR